jgi:hypothetical protein
MVAFEVPESSKALLEDPLEEGKSHHYFSSLSSLF